ncbi:hypothetical protein N8Z47_03975 [Salibacteraceae bacterium]|nr:hypothetical protein [Salibacteraceae bacterium]
MKTRLLIFVSLFIISIQSLSQDFKTYKGAYGDGNAEYTYLEKNNSQRMFVGRFVYSDTLKIPGRGECSVSMTGTYVNGKKSAPWVCTIKGIDNESSETVTGPYKDGQKMGLWTNRISVGSKDVKLATASFYRNTFKNAFNYSYEPIEPIGVYKKLNVTGAFDDKGMYHGEWKISYTNMSDVEYEDVMRYQHGVLAYRLKKEVGTGLEMERFDEEQMVTEFFANLQMPDSNSMVGDAKYGILKKMTKHEVIIPLMKSWNNTRTVIVGNQFSSSIPTMIVPHGEFGDESYLRCEQEIVLWMETPKGHKEWLEEQRILEEYKASIKKADQALETNDFEEALRMYRVAANTKKDESYPNGQIPKVEKMIKDRNTKNRLLKSVKNKADVLNTEQKSIMGNEEFVKRQKHLHAAYQIAFSSQLDDIKEDHTSVRASLKNTSEDNITITQLELYESDLTEILVLQSKLKDLIGTDTKELEKELKKIESATVIANKIKKN